MRTLRIVGTQTNAAKAKLFAIAILAVLGALVLVLFSIYYFRESDYAMLEVVFYYFLLLATTVCTGLLGYLVARFRKWN